MIRIFIVDDHYIIREGVKALLSEINSIEIIGEAENGESALQEIDDRQPDVVLLDINLPDIDGFNVAKKIYNRFSQVKTIVLSGNEEQNYVEKAMSLGVKGYLSKNVSSEELEGAIELVHKGYSVIKPELFKKPSPTVSYSRSASTTVKDRGLDRPPSNSVQTSQDFFPELKETNLNDAEKLIAKKHIQQRYAKYKQRRPKQRFSKIDFTKLKKTVVSFEFGLLVLIILFSLGFLTIIALSK